MKTTTALLAAALNIGVASATAAPADLGPVPERRTASRLAPNWHKGAFIEIFVRGYKDSDGDGIGDLRGLTAKLDYLKELGIKGIWLMPIQASSDHDHGYATADFRAIEPAYGTLADFDTFLREAHKRGIGVVIDYVVNHASRSHPLFAAAAADAKSPWRDWFVWRDAAPDPAVERWDIWGNMPWYPAATGAGGAHYFATFGPHMPDFNLRNAATVAWHEDSLRFWLNRGLDGYRLDAVPHLIENNAVDWNDQPESRALTKRLQDLIKRYPQRFVVCEATAKPHDYAAPEVCGSAFAFNFEKLVIKSARDADAESIRGVADYFKTAPHSLATMLSNHDIFAGERAWDQFGGDERRMKLAAATYLLLPGSPFIYYGEEIGMGGVKGLAGDEPLRAPMSWTADLRGFSASGAAFRPLATNAATHNAAAQARDPGSMLAFYKAMLKLRNARPSIAQGTYEHAAAEGQVLQFQRALGRERTIVLINYGSEPARATVAGGVRPGARLQPLYPAGAALASLSTSMSVILPPLSVQVFGVRP